MANRKILTGLDIDGNIIVSGTVDGRDVATDGTNLDTHLAKAEVHNEVFQQPTEPGTWNIGDIWIKT